MATDYTAQITAAQQAVTYTDPSAGDLAVYNAELNNGTPMSAVDQQIVNSSYTTSVVDPVIMLYQAAFGRVPDAAGLKAEVQAVQAGVPLAPANGQDTGNLAFQFASSAEFTARYGVTATSPNTPALVYLLYQNVLGRAPDAAGLAYWTSQTQLNAQQLLYAFANPTTDPEYATLVSAEVKSYEYDETGGAGSTPVPTTGSLFDVPINQGASNQPGSTFVFTTALDNLTGTTGNDTFTGDNTGTTATVTAGDSVNGLAGTDTFNYFITGGTVVFPQMTAVEIVNLTGAAAAVTANTSAITGITDLNLKNETAGGDTVTVATGTTVGFDNVKVTGIETVNFAATATTGDINLTNGSAIGNLTIAGAAMTSLDINSTGAANTITTLTTTGTAVTSLGITGDQALTITNPLAAAINTVDGSSTSGALTFALGATTATTDSVKTGSGADLVDISAVGGDTVTAALGAGNDTLKVAGALATFLTGTTLDGGDGTDIINLTAAPTKATLAYVSNFETLDVSGVTGATTYDASLTTATGAFATFQADANVNGADTGVVTFINAASGFTFSEIAAKGVNTMDAGLTVTLKDATPTTDAATLNLVATDGNNDGTANGHVTLTNFTATGIENITLSSTVNGVDTGVAAGAAGYTNTITTLTDANLTTLTITGTAGLTITTALAAGTTAGLTTINASGDTGPVTINYGTAVHGVQYTGSAGVDTITTSDGGGIYGAGGNDQITLSTGTAGVGVGAPTTAQTDTLFYKAATDAQLTTSATTGNVLSTSTVETITNFETTGSSTTALAHDTIDLSGIGGFTGVARGVTTVASVDPLSGTFAANQTGFFSTAGGNVGVALDVFGGNTYVFVDANHDGNFNAATDLVVKLAGVTNVTASDFNFG